MSWGTRRALGACWPSRTTVTLDADGARGTLSTRLSFVTDCTRGAHRTRRADRASGADVTNRAGRAHRTDHALNDGRYFDHGGEFFHRARDELCHRARGG